MGVRICVLFDPRPGRYWHDSTLLKCLKRRSGHGSVSVNTRLHDLSYTTRPFKALDEPTRASPYGLSMTSVRSFFYHTTISSVIASALEPRSYLSTDFELLIYRQNNTSVPLYVSWNGMYL